MTGRVTEGTGSLWATDEDVAIKAPNVMTDKSREMTQKVMHSSGDTGLLVFWCVLSVFVFRCVFARVTAYIPEHPGWHNTTVICCSGKSAGIVIHCLKEKRLAIRIFYIAESSSSATTDTEI